ncbi:TetR/AcrR family transcriptional regulator [Almyronema epifaneia]|uniref:TetR/AcrR family transcriptional regulator n=1 Tax=Almyronema epifaneia S1 TaxID=2991925 RepID=A0ABW6IJM1_9CYAN
MDRDEAVTRLVDVFRQYGYEGASIPKLSQAAGLGKSSLYHHFPGGKAEMATAVLDYLGRGLAANILAPLQAAGTPRDRLRAMASRVDRFYQQGQQACLLALLSLGEASTQFQPQVRQIFITWIDALATVAIEAGVEPAIAQRRAEDAVLQIQGAIILAHGLGETTAFARILAQLPESLLSPEESA